MKFYPWQQDDLEIIRDSRARLSPFDHEAFATAQLRLGEFCSQPPGLDQPLQSDTFGNVMTGSNDTSAKERELQNCNTDRM